MFATKWKHEEKSCRDTLATVHDGYNSVVEIDSSLDDSCDRLKTCRDGYVVIATEKQQRGNSFATIRGGGQRSPLGDRVCLFKTAASCLYDPWVRN